MADLQCACGAVLVEEVTDRGVRPRGADKAIVFRRTTDHVVCDACLTSYDVAALSALASGADQLKLRLILDELE